jgi:hypothetical protein
MFFTVDSGLAFASEASFEADRLHSHGNGFVTWATLADPGNGKIRVTNSLLENVDLVVWANDALAPGTQITFAHTTFVLRSSSSLCAEPALPFRKVLFENAIVVASGVNDAFQNPTAAHCTFTRTLLSRQVSSPPAGSIVEDPQFVNPATRDFHLKPTSPAIDRAVSATISASRDLDGVERPQGAAPDLGAYERVP